MSNSEPINDLLAFFEHGLADMEVKIGQLETDIRQQAHTGQTHGDVTVVADMQAQISGYREEVNLLMEQNQQLQAENRELVDDIKSINGRIDEHRSKILRILDQFEGLERTIVGKQLEIDELRRVVAIRDRTIDEMSKDLAKALKQPEYLDQTDLEWEKETNQRLLDEISTLRSKLKATEFSAKQAAVLRVETQKQKDQIAELKTVLERREQDAEIFRRDLRLIREESFVQLNRIKENYDDHKMEYESEIGALQRELKLQESTGLALTGENRRIREKLSHQLSQVESKFDETQSEICNLRETIDLLRTTTSTAPQADA